MDSSSSEAAPLSGLSEAEAARRLEAEGPNELPAARPRGWTALARDVVREPMIGLLLACAGISVALGEIGESLALAASVGVIIAISLSQSRKTERALEALRDLASPRAYVLRGGRRRRIPGREVVRGDLVFVSEGDRVAADSRLLEGLNVSADESLLTGESAPVRKLPAEGAAEPWRRPGGDDSPFLYSGTVIVCGQGLARAEATGASTEMGKIGKAIGTAPELRTRLQEETDRVVRWLAAGGMALCTVIAVVYGVAHRAWLDGLLAGLTVAISILPEEFPVVLTVFLALGAWRLSKRRVLTRRIPALETLGAATILCTDKTGTLTLNRMRVERLATETADYRVSEPEEARDSFSPALPEEVHELLEYARLSSSRDPFDPTEQAIEALARQGLARTEHLHDDWELVREYPLSRQILAVSHVWRSRRDRGFVVAAKGAPEAIADLCHLKPAVAARLESKVQELARGGLRVLGVARARAEQAPLPAGPHDFEFELLGLVGLADPVRPGVPAAIAECRRAGIRVAMVTGDYPATAREIARRAGLPEPAQILTGEEIEMLGDEDLASRLKTTDVFARVVPEEKLRLVEVLKRSGEIVAMTGDGVNDAPALKSSDIGIAMGERGTDVAREAADLVLVNDDFGSMVEAVRAGRRIFDNLRKATAFLLGVHVPIAGMALLPVLLGWPLVFYPIHIVFLELVIDPACSIAFEAEPEEEDLMSRPPRPRGQRLFSRSLVTLSVLQGLGLLAVVFAAYALGLREENGAAHARAMAFATLMVGIIGLILVNRSWSRPLKRSLSRGNPALWWVVGGAVATLLATLFVSPVRRFFRFGTLGPAELAVCFAAGLASLAWFELYKRRRAHPAASTNARMARAPSPGESVPESESSGDSGRS